MKVLIYIEPLTEREAPTWKRAWLEYAALMARAIEAKVASLSLVAIVGDGIAVEAGSVLAGARVEVLKHSELVPRFGATALQVAIGWYRGGTPEAMKAMGDLVKQRVRGFVPDVCITFSPAPFLRSAFPKAPLLHFELGMVSRPPFPLTGYLDPIGMFTQGFIGRHGALVAGFKPTRDELRLVALIRDKTVRQIADSNPLSSVARELGGGFRRRVLLVLQFSNFYAYDAHATYPEQYDLLVQTLEAAPPDVGVFVTEHPQHPLLSGDTLTHLKAQFPNLLWSPAFRETPAASQYLMEHADCVVTVSSSVGWQALLWRKPLLVVGHSHLDLVADGHDLHDLESLLAKTVRNDAQKERVLAWHLSRYASPFDVLFGRSEVVDRIERAIALHKTRELSTYFDKPFAGESNLIATYAEAVDRVGSARLIEESERRIKEMQATLEVNLEAQKNLASALDLREQAYQDRVRELAAEASRAEVLVQQIKTFESQIEASSRSLALVQQQLAIVVQNLSAREADVAELQGRLAAMSQLAETRAAAAGTLLERETALAELRARIAALAQAVEARDLELDSLRKRAAGASELEGRIVALTQQSDSLAAELQARSRQFAELLDVQARQGATIHALESTRHQLETERGRAEASAAEVLLLKQRLLAEAEAAQGRDQALSEAVAKRDQTLAVLTQRATGLEAEIVELQQAISARDTNALDLGVALESLTLAKSSVESRLYQVEGQLGDVEQRNAALSAAIAQADEHGQELLSKNRSMSLQLEGREAEVCAIHANRAEVEADRHALREALAADQLRLVSYQQRMTELEGIVGDHRKIIQQIWSSRSWRLTKGVRFAGRLVRGDWRGAVVALRRFLGLVGEKPGVSGLQLLSTPASLPPAAASGFASREMARSTNGATQAVDSPQPIARPTAPRHRILLVSYYCPSRSHAGGLRILDLYALIHRKAPGAELHLYTHRRPSIDWSEDEVSSIFNRVYWSPTEELSAAGLTALAGGPQRFDVIDLQFHQAALDIDSYRLMGRTILFTPMESLARFSFLQARSAFQATGRFPLRELVRSFRAVAEEVVFSFRVDKVVCVSRSDAAFLRTVTYLRSVQSLETGVSEIEFPGAGAGGLMRDLAPAGQTVLYVAYFGSQTNVDALRWYLDHVHPLVVDKVPGYEFIVVGRGDLAAFADYAGPNVKFVGEVPRLAPYIEAARVGIAPALSGSGFRGKVNQYALFSVPTVVSPISAKGLAYQAGKDILIGRTAQEFADHCVALLRDDQLNLSIGAAARATCAAKYTWESKWPAVARLYEISESTQ